MKKGKAHSPDTVIEQILVHYDTSIAVGSYVTESATTEMPSGFAVPDEYGYARVTSVDREREERAYPKPGRAETPPIGEDLDIV